MSLQPRIMAAHELPNEQYHAMPYISFSQLKRLTRDCTPVDFWWYSWMNPARPKDTDATTEALKTGRVMHTLILEPKEFSKKYVLEPKHKGSENPYIIGSKPGGEWDNIQRMRDALVGQNKAMTILNGCQPEVSMMCEITVDDDPQAPRDKLFTWGARCRHDIYKPAYSCDLKFVEDVSDAALSNAFANWAWYRQAEWYLRIMNMCNAGTHQNFAFIFVEKSAPWKVRVVQPRERVLALARDKNDQALARFKDLMVKFGTHKGQWPGYPNLIYDLVMPGEGGAHSIALPDWYVNYPRD